MSNELRSSMRSVKEKGFIIQYLTKPLFCDIFTSVSSIYANKTTGRFGYELEIFVRTSIPPISGNSESNKTTDGIHFWILSRASKPLVTASTEYPSSARTSINRRRIPSLPSTTSAFFKCCFTPPKYMIPICETC